MESIAYILLYCVNGSLPWQGIEEKDPKEKYKKIKSVKVSISVEKLCMGLPK
jgi:hypothetical protein